MKRDLPDEVVWALQTADGYMDLKMWDKAADELDSIPEAFRNEIVYRQVLLRLSSEREDWTDATSIATLLREDEPDEAAYWIQLAYATRRAESIQEARDILLEALERFPQEPVIPFNLACYACQLGLRDEALSYLEKAESISPACRQMALEDEDLKPLWPELSN